MLEDTDQSQFKPGQIWRYAARPGEEQSTITILKVEKVETAEKSQVIVHIRVDNVKIRNVHSKDGITLTMGHVPLSEEAVERSVPKLAGHVAGELELSGYHEWRAAFEAGKAGVFTITVAECVEYLDKAMNPS